MRTDAPQSTAADSVESELARLKPLLEAQRQSFRVDGPPSLAVRRDRIDRLVMLLTENAGQLADALEADFGTRSHTVSYLSDIVGMLPDIAITRARLGAWMKPRRIRGLGAVGLPTRVEHTPLGVAGIIGPWNFPIGLVAEPAAAAFAGGNRVMIKFSEVTWRTGDLFAALTEKYFDPTELVVVNGGVETAQAFSALPFDHLFFTGSPAVGAAVSEAAGRNLVPVTLELGGKNPAVVGPRADIAKAARRIMAARLTNGGQLCLCPDYVLVPRQQLDEFVEQSLAAAHRICPTVLDNPDLVSVVNERNFDRVVSLIADAVEKGAIKHEAIPPGERLPDRGRRRIAPTLLVGVTDEMSIAHNEVFGPVLSVFPYDEIREAVEYVVERPTPLAAYWYGPTGSDFEQFRERSASGGMAVNDFAAQCSVFVAPFGGLGRSGSGAYHGRTGFDTFTHARTIVRNRLPVSLAQVVTPPFPTSLTRGLNMYVRLVSKRAAARHRRAAARSERRGR